MSIGSIGGSPAAVSALVSPAGQTSAGNALAALASVSPGSADAGLIASVDVASSGVSAALQSLGSALGSIINITA